MNICFKYIYPDSSFILNEMNLFRIVDSEIKESIVFYVQEINNEFKICMLNTLVGNIINVCNKNNMEEINLFIRNIKLNEVEIQNLNDLNRIENYILKLINS